jgi:hypothetical protein
VTFTASILRICVTWQGTNVKIAYNDTEMSKHVAVYIIYKKDTTVMYILVILNVQLLVLVKTPSCVLPYDAASSSLCTASNLTMINEPEL